MDLLYESAQRLNRTLNQILSLSKLEADYSSIKSEIEQSVSIQILIDRLISAYMVKAARKQINLEYETYDESLYVKGSDAAIGFILESILESSEKRAYPLLPKFLMHYNTSNKNSQPSTLHPFFRGLILENSIKFTEQGSISIKADRPGGSGEHPAENISKLDTDSEFTQTSYSTPLTDSTQASAKENSESSSVTIGNSLTNEANSESNITNLNSNNFVQIRIADTEIGIPKENCSLFSSPLDKPVKEQQDNMKEQDSDSH